MNMAKSAKKFYAVKKGLVPGIYLNWPECERNVKGYPGAEYKSFKTENEAKEYLGEYVSDNAHDESKCFTNFAFVDGSFNSETFVYGYGGFLCVDGTRYYPISGSGDDPEMATMRNVAGEIEGAMAAVKKACQLGLKQITILYDYKGVEEWATGSWKTNKTGTKAYAKYMTSADIDIRFQKVATHTGIEGNEIADALAKSAVGIKLTKSQEELIKNI